MFLQIHNILLSTFSRIASSQNHRTTHRYSYQRYIPLFVFHGNSHKCHDKARKLGISDRQYFCTHLWDNCRHIQFRGGRIQEDSLSNQWMMLISTFHISRNKLCSCLPHRRTIHLHKLDNLFSRHLNRASMMDDMVRRSD